MKKIKLIDYNNKRNNNHEKFLGDYSKASIYTLISRKYLTRKPLRITATVK